MFEINTLIMADWKTRVHIFVCCYKMHDSEEYMSSEWFEYSSLKASGKKRFHEPDIDSVGENDNIASVPNTDRADFGHHWSDDVSARTV